MRFTLKQLGYFVAVGEAGSILKASENIHVSQPSISSAVTHLESVFGLQLLLRHHAQGVSLTNAGRTFLREAKALLKQAEGLHALAGTLTDEVVGTIEMGCFNPLAPIIIPDLCHGFMASHPGSDIRIREAHQADLLRLLQQGIIDLALTYDLQLTRDIEFIPLAELPPYALLSETHPLAKQKSVSLEKLASEPMILLDLPLSSEYFMGLFARYNLKPLIKARTALTEVQRGLVASGYGYSLANVRPSNKLALDGNKLVYMALEGHHAPLSLGIAMVREHYRNRAKSTFIEYCKQLISQTCIPGMDLN